MFGRVGKRRYVPKRRKTPKHALGKGKSVKQTIFDAKLPIRGILSHRR